MFSSFERSNEQGAGGFLMYFYHEYPCFWRQCYAGGWDKESGWVERPIRTVYNKNIETNPNNYLLLYNLGVSGNKTSELLKRFESEIVARQRDDHDNLIVLAIGINDSQYVKNLDAHSTQPEVFKTNIERLIFLARKYSSLV